MLSNHLCRPPIVCFPLLKMESQATIFHDIIELALAVDSHLSVASVCNTKWQDTAYSFVISTCSLFKPDFACGCITFESPNFC